MVTRELIGLFKKSKVARNNSFVRAALAKTWSVARGQLAIMAGDFNGLTKELLFPRPRMMHPLLLSEVSGDRRMGQGGNLLLDAF